MANAARRFAQQDELPLDVSQDLQDLPLLDLFNRKVINDSDQCSSLHVASFGQYLVPRHTKFVMSDLDNIDLLRSENDVFDLIVMDPPWPNKSVHRSTDYETQDIYDLFHLPIKSLIKNQGLVAVWVTNKPKYRRFILDKLFKAWQMTCVGEWLWLKVTSSGEPVFPLDSPHRKPYEQLILGRYQPDDTSPTLPNPPQQHVLISVPSIRHSRKPPLGEVLADFLPKQPACLELFARCLTPGWTSWGNECLKFQHESYFISNDTPHSPSAS
ncbi:MT-A70-domain-containing protein [Hesseltinella vesiculosa]|uniref:MT-A70-domain-containing protein n=1 Tax=Hesseltinella vesiculosa TaxID=101127 RepID=A0A1X2GNX5_9FUNG|nr:MT-A70-domain-containing protein [Hesseltinella vesiculosa]